MSHRHLRLVLALSALAVTAPCAPLAAQDAVVREISRLENAWLVAEARKDGAAVGQLLSADFLLTDDAGALLTKAQVIEHISTNPDTIVSEVGSEHSVKVYGNTAVIHGVLLYTVRRGDGTVQTRYRWTDTWVRQADGRWLCVAGQTGRIAQGSAARPNLSTQLAARAHRPHAR